MTTWIADPNSYFKSGVNSPDHVLDESSFLFPDSSLVRLQFCNRCRAGRAAAERKMSALFHRDSVAKGCAGRRSKMISIIAPNHGISRRFP